MTYKLDKWTKHKIMTRSSTLASVLPATRVLRFTSFSSLLEQYNKIIVKPLGAFGGLGVIQVSSLGNEQYQIHSGKNKKTITGLKSAYDYVRKHTKRRTNLVQQKIHLAQIKGKPFDVRVMVQRNTGKSNWAVTGKLAKVAGSGFIITNMARSKGSILPLSTAIRKSNIPGGIEDEIQHEVDRVALKAVKHLHASYPFIRIVGMDIGLDHHGKAWIIEANFEPSKGLFLHLKDKSQFRRIMSYYRKKR